MTTNAPANANKVLWEKGDFTRIANTMRESGDALVERIGVTRRLQVLDAAEKSAKAAELQKELEGLFTRQNQGKDGTSIPATFLRVTVAV